MKVSREDEKSRPEMEGDGHAPHVATGRNASHGADRRNHVEDLTKKIRSNAIFFFSSHLGSQVKSRGIDDEGTFVHFVCACFSLCRSVGRSVRKWKEAKWKKEKASILDNRGMYRNRIKQTFLGLFIAFSFFSGAIKREPLVSDVDRRLRTSSRRRKKGKNPLGKSLINERGI